MVKAIKLVVYPVKDIDQAKKLYSTLLGVDPYADTPYYVGFKVGDMEVGLDPHGQSNGPIMYSEVEDIKASLQQLVDAGAQTVQEPKDVGGGLLIATVKDADGNIIGLRQ
jgi:predicted enzyme related to lactoylglutathione lyase